MQVNLDSLNCGICYCTIEEAVSCESCGNSFCSVCADDYVKVAIKNKNILKCPMCNKIGFNRKKNPLVDDLIKQIIKGQRTYKCQKCNRIFLNEKNYKDHLFKCSKIKCCRCAKIFNDPDSFINHFNEKKNFQEKLFVCTFILNSNLKNIPTNITQDQDKMKIEIKITDDGGSGKNIKNKSLNEATMISNETKINPYISYIDKEETVSDFNVITDNKCEDIYNKEYDLVFCMKFNNQVNGKRCRPGNELCPNCMKINQMYHGLKKHYLINCAGRACTYSKGSVHCNCKFEKEMKHETGRLFSYDFICSDKNNVCLACQYLNKYLDKYLDVKIIEALKKRDKLSGFL